MPEKNQPVGFGKTAQAMAMKPYLIFRLDDQFYAISIASVNHIIRAVQPTPLSDAPALLAGLINMAGDIIPVIDIRKQFWLPEKNLFISDRMIIAKTSKYTVAFFTDAITGVMELPRQRCETPANIFPGLEQYITGVASINSLTILIYDIDTLFPAQRIEEMVRRIHSLEKRT